MKKWCKKHPYLLSILCGELGGILAVLAMAIISGVQASDDAMDYLFCSWLIALLFVYPLLLTVINLMFLIKRDTSEKWCRTGNGFACITIVLGCLYTCLDASLLHEIQFGADWMKTLYNRQVHTPVYTEAAFTVFALAVTAIFGYVVLSCFSLKDLPPLIIVSSFAAMYLGIGICVAWLVQVFAMECLDLCLFPFNCILLAVRLMLWKIREWNRLEHDEKHYINPVLNQCHRFLCNSRYWPVAGLLFIWPLLGFLVCLLTLFGQQPDAVIKAWTETADWNLSNRAAPQNIYYDEHYLCTVAAGGHEKIVKPIRLGKRHGHMVIVNRQLCIANAFEQILEEKVPELHRKVRHFYDTYGFPIARKIHSPYIADGIYLLMKPLEYFFLLVLYTVDVKPENRIAVQYIPSSSHKLC